MAQAPIESLESELRSTSDKKTKAEILIQLSEAYCSSKPDMAIQYAKEALSNLNENSPTLQLHAEICIAEALQTQSRLDESIQKAVEAKEMAIELKDDNMKARSLLVMGNCFRQLNDYKKGSTLIFEALKIYESVNNNKGISDATSAVGIFYFEQKHYDKSLEYFTNSLRIAEKSDYTKGIARSFNNIAVVHSMLGDINKSISYTKRAIELNLELKQYQWLGVNYNNITEDFMDIQQYDSAFNYIKLAIEVNTTINNRYSLSTSYNNQAKYNKITGNPKAFEMFSRKAIETGKSIGNKSAILESVANLQDHYSEIRQYDSAYNYRSLQYYYRDSIQRENSLTRLNKLEMLHTLEKEKQQAEMEQQRRDFIILIIIILLVSIIIFAILLLIRFRLRVRYAKLKEKKLEDEIDFKNREMTTNVMSLMKKNEILSEITKRLIEVQKDLVKDESKDAIQKIAIELESSTQESIWDEFELRFNQVHSDFYERLNSQFPDLTANEQKLCAFLKLNLSTKEISSITGQSNRALEMARFRLRKKLGIDNTDVNLIGFISKI
jgi:tetratricopeptide (TPR) repeat protein